MGGKRKKSIEETKAPKEVVKTTPKEIKDFLRTNAGDLTSIPRLQRLLEGASIKKSLINSLVDEVFEIISSTPHFGWGKEAVITLYKFCEPKNKSRDAFFFPSLDSERKLIKYLQKAQHTMIVCVFAFTNDNLANTIRDVYRRGVSVRVISDDECMKMKGSDVQTLYDEGIPVRTDLNRFAHMHNKFVVIDEYLVITGSFNWTQQAVKKNQENLTVIDDPTLAKAFTEEFNKLWQNFQDSERRNLQPAPPTEEAKKEADPSEDQSSESKNLQPAPPVEEVKEVADPSEDQS